ncbi:DUF1127 domain-containing protein [Candidatus Halocynthiibacter alkanivorans]|jgi:uncharacterized protein YjiS (DUF1127 family)|uniref:DUF1127 domain-containing protein n=1 Tax=Candidatus Halocynthiibacter alkanivorans TaxID=2267619 RepID=UPI000DF2CCFD|nr:DUF1127 domain-containing protein [Candidatus Halocynthiibacter alkanivorans]
MTSTGPFAANVYMYLQKNRRLPVIAAVLVRLANAFIARQEHRQTLRALHTLSDDRLRDIGLTRDQVNNVKPEFWR